MTVWNVVVERDGIAVQYNVEPLTRGEALDLVEADFIQGHLTRRCFTPAYLNCWQDVDPFGNVRATVRLVPVKETADVR